MANKQEDKNINRVLDMEDPTFSGGSVHVATVQLINNTTQEYIYTTELYLDVLKVASSGQIQVTIPANTSVNQEYSLTMPNTSGTYKAYLDVYVDGVLIAHYEASEDIIIDVSPDIDIGTITWT